MNEQEISQKEKERTKRVISAEELVNLARQSGNENLARLVLNKSGKVELKIIDKKENSFEDRK